MHIETLKVFCDLVDLQSFSLAAERNFVTQSAVSQQIRTLEEKFKRRLLERVRGRREVRLTPAGEVFYREAKNVLDCYAVLNESMRGLVGKIGGTVKVADGLFGRASRIAAGRARIYVEISVGENRSGIFADDARGARRFNGTVELGVVAFSRTAPRLDDCADAERPPCFDLCARTRIRQKRKSKSQRFKRTRFRPFRARHSDAQSDRQNSSRRTASKSKKPPNSTTSKRSSAPSKSVSEWQSCRIRRSRTKKKTGSSPSLN
jgi:DNA-binding transcriptional LysR family regulator